MKRSNTLVVLVLAILAAAPALAGAPVRGEAGAPVRGEAGAPSSFAGVWVLDKAKSQLAGPMAQVDSLTWTITQDEKTISIDSASSVQGQDRPAQKSSYNLDGSPTTADIGGRMPGKA